MLLADVRFELTLFQLMRLVKLPLLPICNKWQAVQVLPLRNAGQSRVHYCCANRLNLMAMHAANASNHYFGYSLKLIRIPIQGLPFKHNLISLFTKTLSLMLFHSPLLFYHCFQVPVGFTIPVYFIFRANIISYCISLYKSCNIVQSSTLIAQLTAALQEIFLIEPLTNHSHIDHNCQSLITFSKI